MSLIVCKFGGTSVASPERIQMVAKKLIAKKKAGDDVVAVVSAMGKTTDELMGLANALNSNPPARELDRLLSTGEQVSMTLLAMAIEALGYRINPTAQALKTNRTRSVAIMLPSITSAYSPRIISQIEATLSEFGYTVMIMDAHSDHELEGRKIEMMLDRRVDGFVVFPIDQDERNYRRILNAGVPMCLVDTRMSDLPCVQVLSENAGATRTATEMLLDEGHTRIGIITGNAENATAMERLQGYRDALLQRGLDIQESLIERTPDFSERSGYQSVMRLMCSKDRPTDSHGLL